MSQTKEEILIELRSKQASKRKGINEIDGIIARLSIPTYMTSHHNHMPVTVNKTVIDADELLQLTGADLMFKMGEICAEQNCNPTNILFVQQGRWDDCSVTVDVKLTRLENDRERQERFNHELAEHEAYWKKEVERLMKQHTTTRNSMIRSLNNLVEAELRLRDDDTQLIKDQALSKLSEVERRLLGIV